MPAKAKPNAAKSKPGAKKRAVRSLIGNKAADAMTEADLFAFWSARLTRIAPPIRTSFGNHTVVNSVCRFTVTTSATLSTYIYIPWVPSPLAALQFTGTDNVYVTQHIYGPLATASPNSIRPLRMSFTVSNLTQLVNTAGDIRVFSMDNALQGTWTLGATVGVTVLKAVAADTEWASIIDGSPDTADLSIASLTNEREFVSVPANYPLYNDYYDFVPMANQVTASLMRSDDFFTLCSNDVQSGVGSTYPGATNIVTGYFPNRGLGSNPCLRNFVVRVPATPSGVQTLRFEVHRQDGCRYPVNTLGHTFAFPPTKTNAAGEDAFMSLAKLVSQSPAKSLPVDTPGLSTSASTQMHNAVSGAGSALKRFGEGISAGWHAEVEKFQTLASLANSASNFFGPARSYRGVPMRLK